MNVSPIPSGFQTITPYFSVPGAAVYIDFLKRAFDAQEITRTTLPDGKVMNAELRIGSSMVMVGEILPDGKVLPAMYYLYVENADQFYDTAVRAGAKAVMPVKDQIYGDRVGAVADGFGNQWWIATRKENVSPEEVVRRTTAHAGT